MKLKIGQSVYVTKNVFCSGGKGNIISLVSHEGIDGFYIENVPRCFWHWNVLKDQQKELEELFKDQRAYDLSRPPIADLTIPENFGFNRNNESEYSIIQYK